MSDDIKLGKPVDLSDIDLDDVDPEWLRLRDRANRSDCLALAVNPDLIVKIIDAALDGIRRKQRATSLLRFPE